MPFAQQLGRYQLLDRIAFGGMAEIFRAKTFDATGTPTWSRSSGCSPTSPRTTTSSRCWSTRRRSPRSCSTRTSRASTSSRTPSDEYFIAMEYVDGKDVRTVLERHRAQAESRSRPSTSPRSRGGGARAARRAHAEGRRRPRRCTSSTATSRRRTFCCSYRGEVKLCDFGIAKATLTRVQTKTGVIKGKVKYMIARAGDGAQARPPLRPVLARHRAVRDADAGGALRRRDGGGAHLRGARRAQAGRARARCRACPRSSTRSSTS